MFYCTKKKRTHFNNALKHLYVTLCFAGKQRELSEAVRTEKITIKV